jgi:CDP-glycerol glycerophosphotransferase (TagB/SpsB family)
MYNKTILITVAYGFTIRNILRSKLFDLLRSQYNIILLSKIKDPSFNKEFSQKNVVIIDFPEYKLSKIQNNLLSLTNMCFNEFNKFVIYMYRLKLKNVSFIETCCIYCARMIIPMFGASVWCFFRTMLFATINSGHYKTILEKYKPDIIFSTIQFLHDEWPLIKESKKIGIKTITLIHSWDNLSTKGVLVFKYDKYLVWNEILAKELFNYYKIYNISKSQIEIVGIPQHDYFVNAKTTFKSKSAFLQKYDFTGDFKLILYTTAPVELTPHEDIVVGDLLSIVAKDEFKNIITIVRVHPKDNLIRYHKLPSHNRFIIEPPGRYCKDVDDKWNPSYTDMIHYAELLINCDLNINFTSTVTLDAMAFEKPVINFAYDGIDIPKEQKIRQYYSFDHYEPLTKSNKISIVYSKEELEQAINKILFKEPRTDRFETEIKRSFLFKTDGNAYQRIFQAIENIK